MQAQQAPEFDENKEPSISKEKAKQIFFEQEELRISTMQELMQKAMQSMNFSPEGQMEQMIEAMIANARIVDTIFEKHGVYEDE